MLEDALPEALLHPQLVSSVGGLPFAELLRHLPPGGAGARYPQDAAQHRAVVVVPASCGRPLWDEGLDHLPFCVGKRRFVAGECYGMRSCSILYVAGDEEFAEIAATGFAVTAQTATLMLSSVLLLAGNVLLGVAVWRSGTLPRWAGAL